MESDLVGDFSLCEKYACQIGSFPQVSIKIKDVPPLSDCIETIFSRCYFNQIVYCCIY